MDNYSKERRERIRSAVIDEYRRLLREGGKVNIQDLCRYRLGINRSTFYRWWKKFDRNNPSCLKERKRGNPSPKRISWGVVLRICGWKKENPHKGQDYLYHLLKREAERGGEKVPLCPKTIYNWWRRLEVLKPRKRVRKVRNTQVVREASYPGDLVQIDTKFLENGELQYTAIDVVSKWRYLKLTKRADGIASVRFVEELIKRSPFKIRAIQTDNGPEFQREFTSFLKERGIKHQYIWVRTAKQNGCVERSHRTDDEEFYSLLPLWEISEGELERRLRLWNKKYNEERLHYSLGWKTPIEYLKENT